ncbi:hypothetical protein DZB84_16785 [Bacillus sp. HNG]|uniref:hypothetical protein n=1 Tax=Bacillus sp. HNG TaxID=2293325 RepID=UPI000E2F0DAA|nr:hypothetical protein [Bacillus sp. HNG]RFB13617.1 hypothetical protein DZB84_16785 [Bacillus sp. HNG]
MDQIGSGIGTVLLIQFLGGSLGVTISGLLLTIQDNFSLEIVYRNIYISFSFVCILAGLTYRLYYQRAKLKKQSELV